MTRRDFRELSQMKWEESSFPDVQYAFRIFFSEAVFDQIAGYANTEREVGGILVGHVYRDNGGVFLFVDGVIDALHAREGETEITLTYETWEHVHREMESSHAGKRILGWYHTHPGFGVFLSEKDEFIHKNFFDQPYHVALVYDPISRDHGVFAWREETLWRMRRYWVGDSEHLWDAPRDSPQKAHTEGLSGTPQVETTLEKQRSASQDHTDSTTPTDIAENVGVLSIAVAGIVILIIVAMFAYQVGAWQSSVEARADGSVNAVESLNVDLLEAIGLALGDSRYSTDLEEAEDVLEDVIDDLESMDNPDLEDITTSLSTLLENLEETDHRRVVAEDLVKRLQASAEVAPDNPSVYLAALRNQHVLTTEILRVLIIDALDQDQFDLATALLTLGSISDLDGTDGTEQLLRNYINDVSAAGDYDRALNLLDLAKTIYPTNVEDYDAMAEEIQAQRSGINDEGEPTDSLNDDQSQEPETINEDGANDSDAQLQESE